MKTASFIVTSVMALCAGMTAFNTAADAGHRSRRNAAIGIGVGVAALAIIAANSRKSHAADYDDDYDHRRHYHPYYGHSGGMSCGRLLYKCNHGSDWACEKYETNGCTE